MAWMLLIIILTVLLTSIQNRHSGKSTYIPNPKGHWVNHGTEFNEQWEWREPEMNQLLYVSVRDIDGGYTIVVDDQIPLIEIEYMDCRGNREAKIAVSLFTAHYATLGNVKVTDRIGIDINKEMDGGLI